MCEVSIKVFASLRAGVGGGGGYRGKAVVVHSLVTRLWSQRKPTARTCVHGIQIVTGDWPALGQACCGRVGLRYMGIHVTNQRGGEVRSSFSPVHIGEPFVFVEGEGGIVSIVTVFHIQSTLISDHFLGNTQNSGPSVSLGPTRKSMYP